MNRKRSGTILLAILGFAAASCGGNSPDRSEPAADSAQPALSTRARESALAKSGLPGAAGIGSALRVSDSAAARRRREDSVANAVP